MSDESEKVVNSEKVTDKTGQVEMAGTGDSCDEETAAAELSAVQGTENYIETYHAISEWIRFADAKAAVVLTVGGAMAGFLVPTVHKIIADTEEHLIPEWKLVCYILFGLYILFFLLSGLYAFWCINPLSKRGKHPSLDHCKHFHPAAISAAYSDSDVSKFVEDCDRIGSLGLMKEVQAAIFLDSHISSAKYGRVKKAIFHFAISFGFGFLYFLVAQM